jgi:C4-dicarboxylate-binding protein DctP
MLHSTAKSVIVASGLVFASVASVSAQQSFTLRVGSGHPAAPSGYVTMTQQFFVPEVKKRVAAETKHKVEFVEAYGGTIAGVADTLEAVESGLLDIGAYCVCFEPAKLFIHNFPYYIPFGPQDSATAIKTTRAVYEKVPALKEIFPKQYKQELLGLSVWDNYHLGTVQPWEKVSDLKGVKVGGAGPNLPWLQYAGAVPVQSTLPEGYQSLKTGVYTGWLMFPSAYLGFKFYEPAPHFTLIGFGAMAVNVLTINSSSLSKLPADVQKIIREVGLQYEVQSGEHLDQRQKAGLEGLTKAGAKVRALPEATRVEWAKALAEFPRRMAKEADGKGQQGSLVLKTFVAEIKAAGVKLPFDYQLD